jgi:phosphatidylglycerophosphatase A
LIRRVAVAIATSLGVGYVPIAPGTFGSLAGLLVWWLLPQAPIVQASAVAVLFVLGALSATQAEHHFKSTDPGPVVIDEVMGMVLTMLMNPAGLLSATLGFLWFRAFDIVKPYPAGKFERFPGGWGIMADDAMAGVYANVALRLSLLVAGRFL